MVDKIFGTDYDNEVTPTGVMTISVNNGTTLKDVELQNLHKALTQATESQAGTVELATSAEVLTGTDTARAVTPDTLNDIVARIPSEGRLLNGKISVSVASNNLTVAIKTLAGSDPSSSDPVYVNIDGTVRTITSALSITINAGSNYFNAGSTEFANIEIDYFVYLGWRASNSSIFLLISRISYATTYGDFSTTATNEKYGAYSGVAPTSTDAVVNIGRFNAILSAGAGYTWTVPATSVVINRPILETRALNWTPTLSRSGGAYSNAPTLTRASYQIIGRRVFYSVQYTQHSTPGSSGYQQVTLPFLASQNASGTGFNLNDAYALAVFVASATLAGLRLFKYDGTLEAVASKTYGAWGNYEI